MPPVTITGTVTAALIARAYGTKYAAPLPAPREPWRPPDDVDQRRSLGRQQFCGLARVVEFEAAGSLVVRAEADEHRAVGVDALASTSASDAEVQPAAILEQRRRIRPSAGW